MFRWNTSTTASSYTTAIMFKFHYVQIKQAETRALKRAIETTMFKFHYVQMKPFIPPS